MVRAKNSNPKLLPVDYLRVYVIVVVVAVHSFLAYFSFSPSAALQPFASRPYAWVNYPIVDAQRWAGFDLVFLYNENLVLTLMFLMSGWFVWGSITRKGRVSYLAGRVRRLGIPLVFAVALVSPLAYYPSYALREANPGAADYLRQWAALDFWSPGPAWFIAVLLVLDLMIVPVHRLFPRAIERLARVCSGAARSPGRFYLGLMATMAAVYVALVAAFGSRWITYVPFEQSSRLLVFLMYFFAGVAMGVHATERELLAQDGALARNWTRWAALTAVTFAIYVECLLQVEAGAQPTLFWLAARNTAHLLCGGATCFFMIAVFARFSRRRFAILDSVSANAFGIYLLHYPFGTWMQYALLDAPLSGAQKGLLAFVFTFAGSWATVAFIRQAIDAMRRMRAAQEVGEEDEQPAAP